MSDAAVHAGRVRLMGMPFHEDGEVLSRVLITTLGDTARLSVWSEERQLFSPVDFLDGVKVTDKGKMIEFVGRSRQLRDEVGAPPADQVATWELTPKGCKGCR